MGMDFHPLIGVSGSVDTQETRHYLLSCYADALLAVGAVPVLLMPGMEGEMLEQCLQRLDGIFLSGGNDVSPEVYGCEPIEALGEVNPIRDRLEMRAIRWAFEKRMPVLGICRGVQVMNAAMGGTLWQDLPSQYRTEDGRPPIAHLQKRRDLYPSHTVNVEKDSFLYRVIGEETLRVNSMHHQAVREAAPGLRITARAADGVPEALEHPQHPFFLGVQWHPERYFAREKAALALFSAFAEAAAVYNQSVKSSKNHSAF